MRVLLTGGGTAGHINPALAIADIIRRNAPGSQIEFVGIEGGKEAELVPHEGYTLHYVDSVGFRRPIWSPRNLRAFWLAATTPYAKKTTSVLDRFCPDLVIGTGGYACWPIMAAAARRGIPTAVHESNALPGLAVRKLRKKVDRIWVNFDRTSELIGMPGKTVRVGNPLRQDFGNLTREEARKRLGIPDQCKLILSFGGSLGAEPINDAVVDMMSRYTAKHPELLQMHAAGKRDFPRMLEAFRKAGLAENGNCVISEYLYDMPCRMAAADLVISRAGAMTLSELAYTAKPAVLIPSAHVADNHQYLNAKTLADAGAAGLIEEKDLTGETLTDLCGSLLRDDEKMQAMSREIRRFADADADRLIWQEIVALTANRG